MKWNWKNITIGALLVGAGFAGGVQVGSNFPSKSAQRTLTEIANLEEQKNNLRPQYVSLEREAKEDLPVWAYTNANVKLVVDNYEGNVSYDVHVNFGGYKKSIIFRDLQEFIPNEPLWHKGEEEIEKKADFNLDDRYNYDCYEIKAEKTHEEWYEEQPNKEWTLEHIDRLVLTIDPKDILFVKDQRSKKGFEEDLKLLRGKQNYDVGFQDGKQYGIKEERYKHSFDKIELTITNSENGVNYSLFANSDDKSLWFWNIQEFIPNASMMAMEYDSLNNLLRYGGSIDRDNHSNYNVRSDDNWKISAETRKGWTKNEGKKVDEYELSITLEPPE